MSPQHTHNHTHHPHLKSTFTTGSTSHILSPSSHHATLWTWGKIFHTAPSSALRFVHPHFNVPLAIAGFCMVDNPHMRAHMHAHMYACTRIHIHPRKDAHTYTYMHAHMHTCTCNTCFKIFTCTHTHAFMHMCLHTYTHTHACTPIWSSCFAAM